MMKTKKRKACFMIFFLMGMIVISHAQGIINDAGFISGTATNHVKISGSGDAYIVNSAAGQLNFGNLDVDFTGTGIYRLIVTDTSFITVDGILSLSDTLRLKAGISSMASLITNGSVSGSLAAVEQHITADQWHMVSSPVTTATANVYAGSYLMKWTEVDSTWTFLSALTDPLTITRGYFVWAESTISSPTDVEFTGLLNTGNQTVSPLTYNTGSGKGEGWNLVGNPYPSPIEWNSSWTKTNIDATVYIYDGTTYKTWNYFLGVGSMGNGYIPSTQSFWVKANAAGPSITIPNSARLHKSQAFYKSGNDGSNTMNLNIVGDGDSDVLTIGMRDGATDNFDGDFDAYKLFGIEAMPYLYAVSAGINMAVDIFEKTFDNKSIPLGIKAGKSGKFEIQLSKFDFSNPTFKVYLEDKKGDGNTDKLYDLTQMKVYPFYTEEGMDEDRFVIHLVKSANDNNDLILKGLSLENLWVHSWKKTVMVEYNGDEKARAFVYDLAGQTIATQELYGHQVNKISLNATRGYYLVKVISRQGVKTKKVFVE